MSTDTKHETADLSVCSSCLMVLANGLEQGPNYDDDKAAADGLARNWAGWDISLGSLECDYCPNEDGDCEGWFSWSRCDGCGSQLGGDRYHATAWKAGE